ncbi:MAG: AmmeMemoRadiSam system protein B [Gammaproteobacteria bacterium]|nr:AmmeMemoRadiSam system protein B [Gammaproteobacteria bacterium]
MHATTIRPPAVAGMFYPADADELREWLTGLLESAKTDQEAVKALIVPHAGYIYSGSVAASAYARLRNLTHTIDKVVLLGPAHRVGFRGIAVPTVERFATPLGEVTLDHRRLKALTARPEVLASDLAHAEEHSLEVQLPFLQTLLGNSFELLPLLVGMTTPDVVAYVLRELWDDEKTLIVVSSDLSHYHDYKTARRLDRETSTAIEQADIDALNGDRACGYLPVSGLLQVAAEHDLHAHTIDLRNSGDTAGSRDRVVGYGAYVFD